MTSTTSGESCACRTAPCVCALLSVPTVEQVLAAEAILLYAAEWNETDHPRDDDGRFTGDGSTIKVRGQTVGVKVRPVSAAYSTDPKYQHSVAIELHNHDGLRLGEIALSQTGLFDPSPEGYLSVGTVIVHEDHRGQGFGRALYREALKYAHANGFKGLSSDPEARNAQSSRLWDKMRNGTVQGWDVVTALKQITAAATQWNEADHPRDEDGQFTESGVSVSKITAGRRAYAKGQPPKVLSVKLNKQETGALGERLAIQYLRQLKGLRSARAMNTHLNNFATDVIAGNTVYEIKAGLVSNSPDARRWRVSLGEPRQAEKAKMAKMSPAQLARHNIRKQRAAHQRKQRVLDNVSQVIGHPVKAKTLALILDPDRKVADLYEFDGYHDRIGWHSPMAQAGYRGSVKWTKTS